MEKELATLRIVWDVYNSSLFLRKIASETEKTRTPSYLSFKPGSLEIILTLNHLGVGVDVGLLALVMYQYIKRRRKKVPSLPAPAINTAFLTQMTMATIKRDAGIKELNLIRLEKTDTGTKMQFVDEKLEHHYCFVDFSGEIKEYTGRYSDRIKKRSAKR